MLLLCYLLVCVFISSVFLISIDQSFTPMSELQQTYRTVARQVPYRAWCYQRRSTAVHRWPKSSRLATLAATSPLQIAYWARSFDDAQVTSSLRSATETRSSADHTVQKAFRYVEPGPRSESLSLSISRTYLSIMHSFSVTSATITINDILLKTRFFCRRHFDVIGPKSYRIRLNNAK